MDPGGLVCVDRLARPGGDCDCLDTAIGNAVAPHYASARMEFAVTTPQRPIGVRVVTATGRVIPAEITYLGAELVRTEDGKAGAVQVWTCLTPMHLGDRLHVDVLPAATEIRTCVVRAAAGRSGHVAD